LDIGIWDLAEGLFHQTLTWLRLTMGHSLDLLQRAEQLVDVEGRRHRRDRGVQLVTGAPAPGARQRITDPDHHRTAGGGLIRRKLNVPAAPGRKVLEGRTEEGSLARAHVSLQIKKTQTAMQTKKKITSISVLV